MKETAEMTNIMTRATWESWQGGDPFWLDLQKRTKPNNCNVLNTSLLVKA